MAENVTDEFLSSVSAAEAEIRSMAAVRSMGMAPEDEEKFLAHLSNGRASDEEEQAYATTMRIRSVSSAALSFSDSPLVKYTCLSPNCNYNRGRAIDTITIHEVWGECSMRVLGDIFLPSSRQASSNYGVCEDGVALFVHERDRAWTSGSVQDYRAVTIETSNSRVYPNPVNANTYNLLIDLCTDICRRNGKSKMVWCGSLAKTNARTFAANEMRMTLHRWFQATDCPGTWLADHMQEIANKVNVKLGTKEGWLKENGKWYYYRNNQKLKGQWLKDKGKWYYLDAGTGIMRTGWVCMDQQVYYCGKNGVMLTGFQTIGGKLYYFRTGDSGRMLTGWFTVDGKKHYANEAGVIQTGWLTIKKKKYYFKPSANGAMVTGWYKGKEMWRYFKPTGVYSKAISAKYHPYEATVSVSELNIRKNAGVNYVEVGTLKKGKKVVIVKTKKGKDSLTWGLLADYFEGMDGWIATDYTKKK